MGAAARQPRTLPWRRCAKRALPCMQGAAALYVAALAILGLLLHL
jgi:hypothetical protein